MGNKRIKNTFVLSELFLEGQHTPQDIQKFSRSPLFSIAATLFNTTDKALRVGHVEYDSQPHYNHIDPDKTNMTACLCTTEGLTVAKIACCAGNFSFYTTFDATTSTSMGNPELTTTNSNYIRSKLSKSSKHPALINLHNAIKAARTVIASKLRHIIDGLTDDFYGGGVSHRPRLDLDEKYITFLADIVMGNKTKESVRPSDWTVFEDAYQKHCQKTTKFDSAIDQVREAFDGDKWVLVHVNRGVALGAIRYDGVQKVLDAYQSGDWLPACDNSEYNYANFTIPLKWYPSYEAIPEDYKRDVDYALVMLKAHRGAAAEEDNNMIPQVNRCNWPKIGAFKRDSVMFLPK